MAVLPVMFWSGWLGTVLLLWLCAGALAWCVASIAEADLAVRRAAHQQSGAPSVGGRRLTGRFGDLDPNILLQLDLAMTLHAKARLVHVPRRGHLAARRITYETGLRDLARQWARHRALPIRRGDLVARRLIDAGVIRPVRINQALAWRLAQLTADDAVRTLEQSAGPLVDWTIGPDPDWAGESPTAPPTRCL